MQTPEDFKIVCYLAWCGAEATFGPFQKGDYELARAFLDRIAKVHHHGHELHTRFSDGRNDFYFIEARNRMQFESFMERLLPAGSP